MTALFILQAQGPVPRDLDLPLPLGENELTLLLVILFLVHIFFVNLMIGGSLLSVISEIIGRSSSRYDVLARRIAETVTVNKSLAVVLGVGPLLAINLVYTIHFYSANSLTGYAWLSIIPLVTLAFLLAYLHKYTWDRWIGPRKNMHIMVGAISALVFLAVPLIFLANINLMLFPSKWPEVRGFFSSLQVRNVFPRYFHFLAASLALTGLFLAGWFGRRRYPVDDNLPGFSRPDLRRLFSRIAFYVTLVQLAFGPLLFFTLPYEGITADLYAVIAAGMAIAVIALVLLGREIASPDARIGRLYPIICILFAGVVLAMGTGRHLYREASLGNHKQLIAERTTRFRSIELAAQMRREAGMDAGEILGGGLTGEKIFQTCAACHAVSRVLAGPSLVEIYSIYKDNPAGIVEWAKAPGRKRAEFPPMPSFAHLGDDNLKLVAGYILDLAAAEAAEPRKGAGLH